MGLGRRGLGLASGGVIERVRQRDGGIEGIEGIKGIEGWNQACCCATEEKEIAARGLAWAGNATGRGGLCPANCEANCAALSSVQPGTRVSYEDLRSALLSSFWIIKPGRKNRQDVTGRLRVNRQTPSIGTTPKDRNRVRGKGKAGEV
ncbi:hypothetical protein PAAG_11091 [Paracoccidioides lutzii Pb01]|uniref:Uncharacterized protein n=1 Tax=Paracoccidioides lutzii (strain ATCC MYA-826 / Pb01) TaxID=502779 RepID=A0A0A2VMT3_PARBA|nr:hypothetical protein PAAG_11091 [Paracoccidioides lutzii Pb01]KGQ02139.1 hypothetical protein PAAG_11091 [Paracoccidioides lutzii Pb01]